MLAPVRVSLWWPRQGRLPPGSHPPRALGQGVSLPPYLVVLVVVALLTGLGGSELQRPTPSSLAEGKFIFYSLSSIVTDSQISHLNYPCFIF